MFERTFFFPVDRMPCSLRKEGLVHTIAFDSANPFDHVCRALDAIRKMGFAFVAMTVDGKAGNTFRVSIVFEPRNDLSVATLVERISSCVGVSGLTHDMSCALPA
jgi:hypothetical protein